MVAINIIARIIGQFMKKLSEILRVTLPSDPDGQLSAIEEGLIALRKQSPFGRIQMDKDFWPGKVKVLNAMNGDSGLRQAIKTGNVGVIAEVDESTKSFGKVAFDIDPAFFASGIGSTDSLRAFALADLRPGEDLGSREDVKRLIEIADELDQARKGNHVGPFKHIRFVN